MSDKGFSEAQKQYLAGLTMGVDVARTIRSLPVLAGSALQNVPPQGSSVRIGAHANANGSASLPANRPASAAMPERIAVEAQERILATGKKLSNEEQAKRAKNPLDMWDEINQRSERGEFPKGTDLFLTKWHGLFYVTPAQDSFMCRMRIPGGELRDYQLDGLADLADRSAGGSLDVTTRANLQLRQIQASQASNILYGLRDLGIISLGSGGDNIRNVTASPLSGIDPDELIETLPIARRMHHYITQHREMYGLPRKFNIAYDGGGMISALDDTNDIGFHAVRVETAQATDDMPAGVYFQLTLGGITGHQDFARGTGVLLTEAETLEVAGAIVRVFVMHGDRTDRRRARLKYLLDDWGFEKFLQAVEAELGHALRRADFSEAAGANSENRMAHIDFHPQSQPGKYYVGVVLPVGRMTSLQARKLAHIARRFGSGRLRLTVWQNVILPDIDQADCDAVRQALREAGLDYSATNFRAGLVACTGNAGCKFAASNTKRHAMEIAEYLEQRFELDSPINIHVTGCHHSCAQHYIGDIGLIGAKVEVGDDMVEGYDVLAGGGWGARQAIARPVSLGLRFEDVLPCVAGLVAAYVEGRSSAEQSFHQFVGNLSDEQLQAVGKPLEISERGK